MVTGLMIGGAGVLLAGDPRVLSGLTRKLGDEAATLGQPASLG
jgi:hypothetical protein